MRRYVPCWDAIGITKDRYLELLHFCRQYPIWEAEAASLIGTHGQKLNEMPRGSSVGDPVFAAVERRDRLLAKIGMIDQCAHGVEDGNWYTALVQNICLGRSYNVLDPALLPTSNRNDFFRAKKKFFLALNSVKDRVRD